MIEFFKTWERVQEEEEKEGRHVRFLVFDSRFKGYRDAEARDFRNNPTVKQSEIYRTETKAIAFLHVKNRINCSYYKEG
jgi:hypothetical protein|nr:MAG TPA: hypothetical protein [Caudoviricetes sp.]